jgi:threonine-phosphate decarboxylase
VISGYAQHSGDRHHGAHGTLVARSTGARQDDLLDFSQNINPLGPPPGALEAARAAVTESSTGYPPLDYPELREALARYLSVPLDRVLPTNGGAEALFLAARVAAGRRRRALVLEPTFSEYAAAARAAGMEVVRRTFRVVGDEVRVDATALNDLDAFDAVFLCNPNNPTGDALDTEPVREILERATAAGAVLILDEAFADFAPQLTLSGSRNERLLVTRSFTKFFAMPGLRLGALITDDTERARSFQPSWSVNVAAAAAATVAARDSEYAAATLATVEKLRSELSAGLGDLPGLTVFPGVANFLLVRAPRDLADGLARRGVLVRGCGPFAGLGDEFFRVAVRDAAENARLVKALREELWRSRR